MVPRVLKPKATAGPKISVYEQAHILQEPSAAVSSAEGQNSPVRKMPLIDTGNVFLLTNKKPNPENVSPAGGGGGVQGKRVSFDLQDSDGTHASQHHHSIPDSQDRETLVSPTPAPKRRKTSKAPAENETVVEIEEQAVAQASQTLSPPLSPTQAGAAVDRLDSNDLGIKRHQLEMPVYPPQRQQAEAFAFDLPFGQVDYVHIPLPGFLEKYFITRQPLKMERGGWLFEIPSEWRDFNPVGNDYLFSMYEDFWFNLTSKITSGELGSGIWCSRGTGILAIGHSSVLSSPKTNPDSPSVYVSCWGGQVAEVHGILSTLTKMKFDQIRRVWISESDDKICIDLPAMQVTNNDLAPH